MKSRVATIVIVATAAVAVSTVLALRKAPRHTQEPAAATDASIAESPHLTVAKEPRNGRDRKASILATYEPPPFQVKVVDPLPVEKGTWADIYAKLSPVAEAGDPEAQFRLYRTAFDCYHSPRSSSKLEELRKNLTTPVYDALGNYGLREGTEEQVAASEQRYERCKNAPLEQIQRYSEWVESAAKVGYIRAKLRYADSYPSDDELQVSNPEVKATFTEHERKSVQHLEEAKESGSIDAVAKLAWRYGAPGSESQDPVKSFAHWYAYAWYMHKGNHPDKAFEYLDQMGMKLNPSEYQEAINLGREILRSDNCCFKFPATS